MSPLRARVADTFRCPPDGGRTAPATSTSSGHIPVSARWGQECPRYEWRIPPASPAIDAIAFFATSALHAVMSTGRVKFCPFNDRGELLVARNHLPHWTQAGRTYFITFHLGDSLPESKLGAWREQRDIWLKLHPRPWSPAVEAEYNERFAAQIDAWLDAGHGACPLRRPEIRMEVERCLLAFDNQRHDLDAFVIMPNHVHALIAPRESEDLFALLKGIKGASARACNRQLGITGGSFWMEDSYNRIVRNVSELQAYRRYIAENPAKARLREGAFSLVMQDVLIV